MKEIGRWSAMDGGATNVSAHQTSEWCNNTSGNGPAINGSRTRTSLGELRTVEADRGGATMAAKTTGMRRDQLIVAHTGNHSAPARWLHSSNVPTITTTTITTTTTVRLKIIGRTHFRAMRALVICPGLMIRYFPISVVFCTGSSRLRTTLQTLIWQTHPSTLLE